MRMGRLVVVILGVLLLVMAIGLGILGAFPPAAKPEQVQRILPNERFNGR